MSLTVSLHNITMKSQSYHADDLWVNWLSQNSPTRCDVVHQFIKCAALHLLPLQVGHRVEEIESHTALPKLPQEQVLLLGSRNIWQR